MLEGFFNRQPGRPWYRIVWWHVLHFLCFGWFRFSYRFRAWGIRNLPAIGPVLLVANHQSFLDPIIVGLAAHHRQFYAMARSSLFDDPRFAWLIRSLNAIPVEQGAGDLKAMRACIDVLKRGHALLIFPEGSRTLTGTTLDFETGTMLLIKRSGAAVVPVAIDGAFEAWPRGQAAPKPFGRIGVAYGEPIPAETLTRMQTEQAMRLLRDRVETMRLELAEKLDPKKRHTQPFEINMSV